MKKIIASLLIGLFIGFNLPANAVKSTPTPHPTITITATPVTDPASYLHRYCYGVDMVYMIDNSEWNHTPSTIDVVANSPACAEEKASAGLRIVK